MMGNTDYYAVLGVSKDADEAAIKKAYRKRAKKYHPDMHPDDAGAAEKFRQVNQAYNILSDKEKRKVYDRFGPAAFDENGNLRDMTFSEGGPAGYDFGGSGFGGGPGYSYREFHFGDSGEGADFSDLFGDLFGRGRDFGSSFGGSAGNFDGRFGRSRGTYRPRPRKGQDLSADITISFDEAVFGCEKTIHFQDETGGKTSLKVSIPAGIDSGKKIRLQGKGAPGSGGGKAGDLLLHVTVADKAGYERKGYDIYTKVQIPFTTAVFGGEAIVSTLYGDVSCKIRPGTQSGSKLRLKGKGVPHMRHPDDKGDQYTEIQIQVPRNLSPRAREKLHEYEKAISA